MKTIALFLILAASARAQFHFTVDNRNASRPISQSCADSVNLQIQYHWFPQWGSSGTIRIGVPGAAEIPVAVTDYPYGTNMYGFHVFNGISIFTAYYETGAGRDRCSLLSHEILEYLANPNGLMGSLVYRGNGTGTFYNAEPCDPVQDDLYYIQAPDGAWNQVQNFVIPRFYIPSQQGGCFNIMCLPQNALQMRSGFFPQVSVYGLPGVF